MKKSLLVLYLFLKKPQLLKKSKNRKQLLTDFFSFFLLDFAFALSLGALFYLLLHFKLITEYAGVDFLKEFGILGSYALACIAAPLIEEFIFRWHLRDLYGAVYFVFLSIAGLVISKTNEALIQLGAIIFALFLAVLVISFLRKRGKVYAVRTWQKGYPFLFYYTAIIFGFIHLSNYKDLTLSDPSFVFYIASQTFGALGLGYLRIKYGLIYSILFHALFNFVAVTLSIIFE